MITLINANNKVSVGLYADGFPSGAINGDTHRIIDKAGEAEGVSPQVKQGDYIYDQKNTTWIYQS